MSPRLLGALAMIGVATLVLSLPAVKTGGTAEAIGSPEIAVGQTSLSAGTIRVPIVTQGADFDPYTGFSIHLRWNSAIFSIAGADETGGPFDGSAAVCLGPTASSGDADHGGAVLACSLIGGDTTSSAGLLATFTLTPTGAGCSPLHLTTLGPPDGGDTTSGSYTIASGGVPQSNTYLDGTSDENGAACGGSQPLATVPLGIPTDQGTPLATFVSTPVPGATETAAANATTTAGTATPNPQGTTTPGAQGTTTPGAQDTTTPGAQDTTTPGGAPSPVGSTTTGSGTPGGSTSVTRTPGTPSVTRTVPATARSSATATATSASTKSSSGSHTGLIIGIIVAIAAVGAAAGGGWWYWRNRQ